LKTRKGRDCAGAGANGLVTVRAGVGAGSGFDTGMETDVEGWDNEKGAGAWERETGDADMEANIEATDGDNMAAFALLGVEANSDGERLDGSENEWGSGLAAWGG
jgi:hypothetical protein